MSTAAKRIDETEAFTTMGSVQRVATRGDKRPRPDEATPFGSSPENDDEIVVATARGNLRCKRAVGCLVAPEVGDYVLVAGSPSGACFVLSVLERESADATLSVEGNLQLSVGAGGLRILARDGIELLTPRKLELAGHVVELTAERARMVVDELSYLGSALLGEIGRVRTRATSVDTVIGRLTERVRASFRRVDEIDQLDAGRIDHKAKETMTLRAKCALVSATEVVRVDGEQIMMG
jgi:hypothetical protein